LPTSFPNQISTIIGIILRMNPASMLDIGPGFGKYGFLSREYLESWFGSNKLYQFTHRIDAVEFCEDYISPVHRFIYDNIYIGNVETELMKLPAHYELSLLIDVIEHFSLEEGKKIIARILTKADSVIISTPKHFIPQTAIYGNEKETHLSLWKKRDFREFGRGLFFYDDENIIWYYGKQIEKVKPFCSHQWLKHYFPISYQLYKWLSIK